MVTKNEFKKIKSIFDDFGAGFRDKRDIVNEPKSGSAVSGSQNILIIDGEKIGNRPGYTRLGASNNATTGNKGGGNWKTHRGVQIPWRSYDDELEFYTTVTGTGTWQRLANGFTNAKFRADSIWNTTEAQDLLIFVNGDSNLRMWSGGITTFASATVNTITKQGTTTWAEEGFLTAGTRQVIINGTTYTYTGGESTTTLTGVTPDPTVAGHAVGSIIHQALRTSANTPASGFNNDFVSTLNNQLYVFDRKRRDVYLSKNNDFTSYTFSSPRLPGEGALFTLDETPTSAIPLEDKMAISTRNHWYNITLQLSDDLTKETIIVNRLKTSPLEGASYDLSVTRMKNYVVSVSNEPTIDTLGNIENIATPQNINLSDHIKNSMDDFGVDEATAFYHKNYFYVGLKNSSSSGANNRIIIRNLATGSWETPWLIPAGIIFEYNGDLYCHSSVQPETYKLLDGFNDDGVPISAKWFSPFENFGYPFNFKVFTSMWIDGYIRAGTTLNIFLNYDFGESTTTATLKGTNTNVVYTITGTGLGQFSLGSRNLGGTGETLSETGLKRFRGFISIPPRPFYELQVSFQSDGTDYRWEVVRYGFNVVLETAQNNTRKIN